MRKEGKGPLGIRRGSDDLADLPRLLASIVVPRRPAFDGSSGHQRRLVNLLVLESSEARDHPQGPAHHVLLLPGEPACPPSFLFVRSSFKSLTPAFSVHSHICSCPCSRLRRTSSSGSTRSPSSLVRSRSRCSPSSTRSAWVRPSRSQRTGRRWRTTTSFGEGCVLSISSESVPSVRPCPRVLSVPLALSPDPVSLSNIRRMGSTTPRTQEIETGDRRPLRGLYPSSRLASRPLARSRPLRPPPSPPPPLARRSTPHPNRPFRQLSGRPQQRNSLLVQLGKSAGAATEPQQALNARLLSLRVRVRSWSFQAAPYPSTHSFRIPSTTKRRQRLPL